MIIRLTSSVKVIYLPINLIVSEKQDFVGMLIIERSVNFLHLLWQTKAAEILGISSCQVIAIESPNLFTCMRHDNISK